MKRSLLSGVACAALALGISTAQAQEVWQMQSTYPGSLTQLGTLGKWVAERITAVTDGEIVVEFQEPGAIVPALEVFDAVASGAVETGWSTPGYWAGKVPALQFMSAVPFGPEAGEYLAWMKFGGGQDMMDEIYARLGPPEDSHPNALLDAISTWAGTFDVTPLVDVELRTYPWQHRYTRDEWLDQLPTHSNHRVMDPAALEALLDAVGALIDDHGGSVVSHCDTTVLLALRA